MRLGVLIVFVGLSCMWSTCRNQGSRLDDLACVSESEECIMVMDVVQGEDDGTENNELTDNSSEETLCDAETAERYSTIGDHYLSDVGDLVSSDGCLVAGGFFCPCVSDGDCTWGYCVEYRGSHVCTESCDVYGECPIDWACKIVVLGPNELYMCMPSSYYLCRPCKDSTDCKTALGRWPEGNGCIDRGSEGNFCGTECYEGTVCPNGYECAEVTLVEGGTVEQCIPKGGLACECEVWFVGGGDSTSCFEENEYGKCYGDRGCTAFGLSECDAGTPEAERCDGQDNDCDGEVDEGVCL